MATRYQTPRGLCSQCELRKTLGTVHHECPRHDSRTPAQKINDDHQQAIDIQEAR